MHHVQVLGGGPSGSAAALSALGRGAGVTLYEPSRFPRHKVCGEFLSPEIADELDRLGAWGSVRARQPAVISHVSLQFGRITRRSRLPHSAYGLSRHALDDILLQSATSSGAEWRRERATVTGTPSVLATGRVALTDASAKGERLFGFKAHFRGPQNEAVELHFFDGCYVGVNAIEDGQTNVCGIAPERILRRFGFEHDELVRHSAALRERLAPLTREMGWLSVGPLLFRNRFRLPVQEGTYPTGDALSFVDPFTGSGLLSAVVSGRLAGMAAAEGWPAQRYLEACRRTLGRPYWFSSILRSAVFNGWANLGAAILPGALLFRLTRPRVGLV